MTVQDVIALLKENKDERGIAHWQKLGDARLESFGLGLTRLKSLAKEIGRNHPLALALWQLPIYDAKILATLIDDPRQITPDQVEQQVKDAKFWLLSYSYCSNLMPKLVFVTEKTVAWTASSDHLKRRCGYLLLAQIAKKDAKLGDEFFESYLDIFDRSLQTEENFVKDAMNNALLAIGQRSKRLYKRALEIARKLGKVEVDYGDNSCQAIDCYQHLSQDRLVNKFL